MYAYFFDLFIFGASSAGFVMKSFDFEEVFDVILVLLSAIVFFAMTC